MTFVCFECNMQIIMCVKRCVSFEFELLLLLFLLLHGRLKLIVMSDGDGDGDGNGEPSEYECIRDVTLY